MPPSIAPSPNHIHQHCRRLQISDVSPPRSTASRSPPSHPAPPFLTTSAPPCTTRCLSSPTAFTHSHATSLVCSPPAPPASGPSLSGSYQSIATEKATPAAPAVASAREPRNRNKSGGSSADSSNQSRQSSRKSNQSNALHHHTSRKSIESVCEAILMFQMYHPLWLFPLTLQWMSNRCECRSRISYAICRFLKAGDQKTNSNVRTTLLSLCIQSETFQSCSTCTTRMATASWIAV